LAVLVATLLWLWVLGTLELVGPCYLLAATAPLQLVARFPLHLELVPQPPAATWLLPLLVLARLA
jgi:hypothetical protein